LLLAHECSLYILLLGHVRSSAMISTPAVLCVSLLTLVALFAENLAWDRRTRMLRFVSCQLLVSITI
jgi:hypothetical protein